MRVVVDTNVWISGLLSKSGPPGVLARRILAKTRPVLSAITWDELAERIWRAKFDRYVTPEQRQRFLTDLRAVSQWVAVPPALAARSWCRDASDDAFIQAALAAEAPFLITGDQDLLVLAGLLRSEGLRVLTPATALTLPEFTD